MTPTEAIPGHIIEIVDAPIGALCTATTVLIAFAIEDHPHREVPQLIPEITVDPDHILHINQVRKLYIKLHPVLTEPQRDPRTGNITKSQ